MPTPRFNWPLATAPFTFWDRLKVAAWVATQDQFTMATKVAQLEWEMSKLAGGRPTLMVANGSLANQLVFELWKVKNREVDPRDVVVIVPAVTWISSITPILSLGFKVVFCDVNLDDFSFDYDMLANLLDTHAVRRVIIWPTALIGFVPDMARIKTLAAKHGAAEVYLDSCENTLSVTDWDQSILASADMVTTSTYTSHQLCSVEGGFVFFKDETDYMLARMLRNHGLTRSLTSDYASARKVIEDANPTIDPSFLFAVPGTNLRPSDLHAAFGLCDIKRVDQYRVQRKELYRRFHEGLDKGLYYLPELSESHVGFCLPILRRAGDIEAVKRHLNEVGIQTRPIIGANLLHQPPFKAYGDPATFPKAEWIHTHGCYVGLGPRVTEDMVDGLVEELNAL